MRRNASGRDEPRDERAATHCAKPAGTKWSGAEALVAPAIVALVAAVICAHDVSARFAPFDRKDRSAAALADGSTTLAGSSANSADSPVIDAGSASADLVPGIPDASGRLLEQIRTANALGSTMPAGQEGDPAMTSDPASNADVPASKTDVPASKAAPYQSPDAPARSKSGPSGSRKQVPLDPESAESALPAQSLAWLGLLGVAGAGLTWWFSRRRTGRANSPGSLSPEEVRAALAEIAASKRRDLGRPDLSVITRSPAKSTPVGSSAGEDRLERIERSLLDFTGVVQALVESIPARSLEQEKSAGAPPVDPSPGSNADSVSQAAGLSSPGDGSSEHAASETSNEPPRTEEDLASAWDCFLQSEGVEPPKSPRKRSSGASRIARQGRTRAASARGNTQDTSAPATSEKNTSPGQTLPGDPLHDLGRIREVVLDLAGRGVPTEQICREVGLSSKEVGLILKSLFRANA
jgi:hypothetical protein